MKRFLLLIILVGGIGASYAQIYNPEGINMPGAWNSWNQPPTVAALASATQASGNVAVITTGTRRYHTTIKVASSGGDVVGGTYDWLFTSGPSSGYYNNKWGGTTVTMNSIQSYTYQSGTNNSITVTNGKWYTVNWKDIGYTNTTAIFMATSGLPVTITAVSHTIKAAGQNDTVSITLSGTPSAEEIVYVRYTTDGWSTSTFLQATGSGSSRSAIIPGSATGGPTSSNQFYVLTTTVSSPAHADADMVTINYNNNSGNNYLLPVELTDFTSVVYGREVQLNWQTATEVNSAKFVIERSVDKINWERRGDIRASGYSNAQQNYNFTDHVLTIGKFNYRLKMIDNDGTFEYSKVIEAEVMTPAQFGLSQNYPNPFNPATTINYDLAADAKVVLELYAVTGEKIKVLVNETQPAGYYAYKLDMNSLAVPSGMYVYKLSVPGFSSVKKMVYLR